MAIGSAIASVAGGIMNYKSAKSAQKASDAQTAFAMQSREQAVGAIEGNQANVDALQQFLTSMGTQGVEYAQGLLDSWEGSFGGIQDNLSNYYNNLDPEKFATQNKVQFKQALDKQMKQYNETMAASGLQSAGMKAQAYKEAAFKTAEANAQFDISAPEQVAQMQQGFLSYGDAQRSGAQNAMSTAMANQAQMGQAGYEAQTNQASSLANAYLGQASAADKYAQNYGASAAGYNKAAGNMIGAGFNALGGTGAGTAMDAGITNFVSGMFG